MIYCKPPESAWIDLWTMATSDWENEPATIELTDSMYEVYLVWPHGARYRVKYTAGKWRIASENEGKK